MDTKMLIELKEEILNYPIKNYKIILLKIKLISEFKFYRVRVRVNRMKYFDVVSIFSEHWTSFSCLFGQMKTL